MHCLVVISTSQSTKHRVTLFHYVVFAQYVCCTSTGTMSGQYGCKITKYLGNGKESSGKIWYFPKKLLSLQRQTSSLATPLSAGSKALQILLHLNKGCINKRCSFSVSRIVNLDYSYSFQQRILRIILIIMDFTDFFQIRW